MFSTVVVSIGRNVGTVPLSDDVWSCFVRDVGEVLTWAGGTLVVEAAESAGVWDGVVEESATFVAVGVPVEALLSLRSRLARLAGFYGQEAIAVTTGSTDLVSPDPVV